MSSNDQISLTATSMLPMLPLRDVVVFPHMVLPLFVGREMSINALNSAMEGSKQIVLSTQINPTDDEPGLKDIYLTATVANILQMLKLPDGTVKVLVEGEYRAKIKKLTSNDFHQVEIEEILLNEELEKEGEILIQTLLEEFERYCKLSKKIPSEVVTTIVGLTEPGRLVDTISGHLELKIEEKQELLEEHSVADRAALLLARIEGELDLIQVEKRIRGRVKKQMEKSQREYYLNEQMKAIQREMGAGEDGEDEFADLDHRIDSSGMPEEALKKARSEVKKLRMMPPMSAEATVVRSYLDCLLELPWKKRSKVRHDLARAKQILDEDHYGLTEVKERILEYLAVQGRVKKIKGPVLCLVGPPGVGKTSLGQSIAKATNRKFTRMALGGVRDEAEIRGHRRTYIGSMPGKLIQKITKVGVKNPMFLLDEIDKLGADHRGDPASALLEVLDPEQNHTFNDHYLELDYDLSDVMFVCTSNTLDIPPALMDRMEIIRIPGYTEYEKMNIAKRYLLPKQIKLTGLKEGELVVDDESILNIIRYYTREAGVRGLERELAKLCRKIVKQNALKKEFSPVILDAEELEEHLGVRKYNFGIAEQDDKVGQVTGLAWTQVGGELLTIECTSVKGKGRTIKTGSLGDVMQESIQAAMTVVRSRAIGLGIDESFYENQDVHIHVPEGATPKDGPSAGIAMCTALVSSLTQIPVRSDVAMTGEITLRGQVLAIGGLKEKLLAAHRGGIKTVIIPFDNKKDLKEIPENIKSNLEIIPVEWIDQVFDIALVSAPKPKIAEESIETVKKQSDLGGETASTTIKTH
jgi:ATP-dependent Lon protease